jgi:transcriptional regulator with XRE-family HTH domain
MHRGVRVDGPAVKRLRKSLGLSQLLLAKNAGISERTVRNAEKSQVLESHIANYLAVALDVPLNEIVSERACTSRSSRLNGLIRKVSTCYVRAILKSEMQSLVEIVHPEISWNCYAAPDQCFSGCFHGIEGLRKHLILAAQWWEQFAMQANDLAVRRTDAEGEMVYFLLTGRFENDVSQRLEIWQTFICRFDDDLLISVDQSLGVIASDLNLVAGKQQR